MAVIEGNLDGKGLRVAIIQARFNSFIASALVEGAKEGLRRHGVDEESIDIIKVPGAMRYPTYYRRLLEVGIMMERCLGAVIRGATPHFDFVAGENASGIQDVMLTEDFPAAYGVITPNNLEQAIERAGVKSGNKGYEAAVAAIEMINLVKSLLHSKIVQLFVYLNSMIMHALLPPNPIVFDSM